MNRAKLVADRAAAELAKLTGQVAVATTPPVIPSLSGIKIGDPLSSVSIIGIDPVARNRVGPFTVMRWSFPDGNELSVTASSKGAIVYIESDWGEKQPGITTDYGGLFYGRTTLSEIRQRFGSNGFAFTHHGGVVKVRDGLVLINSYEVGSAVATFVTKAQVSRITSEGSIGEEAVLVAISLADPTYANNTWGARSYDPEYHSITWR